MPYPTPSAVFHRQHQRRPHVPLFLYLAIVLLLGTTALSHGVPSLNSQPPNPPLLSSLLPSSRSDRNFARQPANTPFSDPLLPSGPVAWFVTQSMYFETTAPARLTSTLTLTLLGASPPSATAVPTNITHPVATTVWSAVTYLFLSDPAASEGAIRQIYTGQPYDTEVFYPTLPTMAGASSSSVIASGVSGEGGQVAATPSPDAAQPLPPHIATAGAARVRGVLTNLLRRVLLSFARRTPSTTDDDNDARRHPASQEKRQGYGSQCTFCQYGRCYPCAEAPSNPQGDYTIGYWQGVTNVNNLCNGNVCPSQTPAPQPHPQPQPQPEPEPEPVVAPQRNAAAGRIVSFWREARRGRAADGDLLPARSSPSANASLGGGDDPAAGADDKGGSGGWRWGRGGGGGGGESGGAAGTRVAMAGWAGWAGGMEVWIVLGGLVFAMNYAAGLLVR